jgi:hypothetical protein
VDPKIEQEVDRVLGLLSRARTVFGADIPAVVPPKFTSARDLEDNLGRGHF